MVSVITLMTVWARSMTAECVMVTVQYTSAVATIFQKASATVMATYKMSVAYVEEMVPVIHVAVRACLRVPVTVMEIHWTYVVCVRDMVQSMSVVAMTCRKK